MANNVRTVWLTHKETGESIPAVVEFNSDTPESVFRFGATGGYGVADEQDMQNYTGIVGIENEYQEWREFFAAHDWTEDELPKPRKKRNKKDDTTDDTGTGE